MASPFKNKSITPIYKKLINNTLINTKSFVHILINGDFTLLPAPEVMIMGINRNLSTLMFFA